ncbi:MAG: hypothetical protein ACFB01_05650 [Cohaesibacteraceae bacterium]
MGGKNENWNDDELRVSVDAYLYMLQLEYSSIPFSPTEYSKFLRTGPLRNRNDASIRYRMRNISQVMQERDAPILRSFSPAPQVGKNVKRRINELLNQRQIPAKAQRMLTPRGEEPIELADILVSLRELKGMLADIEPEHMPGFGHNNPPGIYALTQEDVLDARDAVAGLERELPHASTDRLPTSELTERLSRFGLKFAVWIGHRVTDFSKAGAVAAGTGFGVWLSGLGDKILEVLRLIVGFVG